MDMSKLVIKLSVNDFYDNYTQTLRELYSESFIVQNNLQPATQNSFQRAMSKRAGISLDKREEKSYTEQDLEAIVKDTNDKYEEYANGSYSDSVKKRGQTRYILMATVLKETFKRLGYHELAEQFKYVQDQEKTTADNVIKAYHDAEDTEDETEDTSVEENIKLLKDSLTTISQKINEYEDKYMSDKDKKVLNKVMTALKDTIDSAKNCVDGKQDTAELSDLITEGEALIKKGESILAGKQHTMSKEESNQTVLESLKETLEEKQDNIPNSKVTDFDILIKAASMLPDVVFEIRTLKEKVTVLSDEKEKLEQELAAADKKAALPEGEDELVHLAKQVINKIEDKGKLKDIAMVIMMKAM